MKPWAESTATCGPRSCRSSGLRSSVAACSAGELHFPFPPFKGEKQTRKNSHLFNPPSFTAELILPAALQRWRYLPRFSVVFGTPFLLARSGSRGRERGGQRLSSRAETHSERQASGAGAAESLGHAATQRGDEGAPAVLLRTATTLSVASYKIVFFNLK